MASILTGEYIPIDELVPPEQNDKVELLGTITNLTILGGGFVYAQAVFGITDSVDKLTLRRTTPAVISQPLQKGVSLTGLTSKGNALYGNCVVEAEIKAHDYRFASLRPTTPEWVNEIAGKMACISFHLDQGLPLFTTNYQIRDGDPVPSYSLERVFLMPADLPD